SLGASSAPAAAAPHARSLHDALPILFVGLGHERMNPLADLRNKLAIEKAAGNYAPVGMHLFQQPGRGLTGLIAHFGRADMLAEQAAVPRHVQISKDVIGGNRPGMDGFYA